MQRRFRDRRDRMSARADLRLAPYLSPARVHTRVAALQGSWRDRRFALADLRSCALLGRARQRHDVRDHVDLLLPTDDPGRHHAAPLLDGGGHFGRVEAGLEQRRPDPALSPGTVAAGAVALVHDLAAIDVAGGARIASRRRGRREDLRLREREGTGRDRAADDDRAPPAADQNPNLTVVKYQRLDVTQSATSVDASVRPALGSAQRGSDWSRTISTFAANTP